MKKCLTFCGVISYLGSYQTSHKDPILNPVPRSKVDLGNPFFQSLMKYFCSCWELNNPWLRFVVTYSNFTGSPTFKLFYLKTTMMAALTFVLSSIYSWKKKWRYSQAQFRSTGILNRCLRRPLFMDFFCFGENIFIDFPFVYIVKLIS